jgi:ABC-2 type transport system ATP-binding protein
MAYTPNDSMPSDSPQNYSVYTQDGAAQANAAQTDMAQNNAAQTDTAQNNTAQTDLVQNNATQTDTAQDNAPDHAVSLQKPDTPDKPAQDTYPQDHSVQNIYPQNTPDHEQGSRAQNGTAPNDQVCTPNGNIQSSPGAAAVYSNLPLLQLNDLCKRYPGMGTYMSVFHMNLIIPRGRIIGLLGPNGCGKTTLIKMINGLLTPTSGTVLINGMEPCPATKKIISYLPERTYLDNSMKVSQMVSYFADFYEDFSPEKAYAMLGALGISSDARLKTLSKGTKEKVQLILVMSRQADLYILDEPIAGVDPAARDYILRTIITNYNPNSTIILSTHLISDIENVLDDVIFMKNGSLMLYTSVDSIRSQMGKSVDTYFREVYAC